QGCRRRATGKTVVESSSTSNHPLLPCPLLSVLAGPHPRSLAPQALCLVPFPLLRGVSTQRRQTLLRALDIGRPFGRRPFERRATSDEQPCDADMIGAAMSGGRPS